jgi:ribonuclease P protein component
MPPSQKTFPKSRRIGGRGSFAAIRDAAVRESRGPLIVWTVPNNLKHCRLGISIGRHCGNAVCRNRIKRLLRESFRLLQNDFPVGYDLLISVRPHTPLILAEYQKLLSAAAVRLHGVWQKRV